MDIQDIRKFEYIIVSASIVISTNRSIRWTVHHLSFMVSCLSAMLQFNHHLLQLAYNRT